MEFYWIISGGVFFIGGLSGYAMGLHTGVQRNLEVNVSWHKSLVKEISELQMIADSNAQMVYECREWVMGRGEKPDGFIEPDMPDINTHFGSKRWE